MSMRRISAFIFAFALFLGLAAGAQAHPAERPNASEKKLDAQGANAAERSAAQSTTNQQLTHASNEAAGRPAENEAGKKGEADQNEAFRQSASVRGIARITGLSLAGAYWLAIAINFLIVVVLVWLGLKSNLPKIFRERTEAIQKSLAEARRASEDAGRRLAGIEERLSTLGQSISEMQVHADAESKSEEQRIWAAAEEEKRKIVEAAEQEIAAAANAARRELKLLAVELALATAEKQIKVDASQDKRLVQDFAEQLLRTSADGRR